MAKNYRQNAPIEELNPGDNVQGFYLLASANVKTSANGSKFLACKIADVTGEMDGKIWDYSDTIHEHVGGVIKLRGAVSEYNGAKQIVIEMVRLPNDTDTVDLSAIVPCAPIDTGRTFQEVCDMLEGVQDPVYRAIAHAVFTKIKEDFKVLPAGKSMHHAFLNGLLMHTYHIMQMAQGAAAVYAPYVNGDLLLVGAFCHDMAKRHEFTTSDIGLVTGYTVPGNLLGHLVMGAMEIRDIGVNELQLSPDNEKLMLLEHMLLSHHGEPAYGAAVVPKLLEAEILSRLDDLDAKVEMYRTAVAGVNPGEMTDFVKGLNRPLYRPLEE